MNYKKIIVIKTLTLLVFLNFSSILKSQPRLELGGGVEFITWQGKSWKEPRILIVAPELLMNHKLGFYFALELQGSGWLGGPKSSSFFNSTTTDNWGITYKVYKNWSAYYGHALINLQTPRPELFPFTGRQDMGISYAFNKLPLNLKAGYCFWLGPTLQLTGNVMSFVPKDSDNDGVLDKYDHCKKTLAKYAGKVDVNGCPVDSDRDGVFDVDDRCPTEKGLPSMGGCPEKIDTAAAIDWKNTGTLNGNPELTPDTIKKKNPEGNPETNVKGGDKNTTSTGTGNNKADAGKSTVKNKKDKGNKAQPKKSVKTKKKVEPVVEPEEEVSNVSIKDVPKEEITEKSTTRYPVNSFELTPEYKKSLSLLIQYLKSDKTIKIRLEGHTDQSGPADFNMILSVKRANAVKKYMVSKGVYSYQIEVKGMGETNPKYPEDTEEGKEKNRRVEIIFID